MSYGHLEELLNENVKLAKENNKILRRMERNALIGLVFKVVLWLVVLGVPLYFLSTYVGPLTEALRGSTVSPTGLFGLPSAEQLQKILETYKSKP